MDSKSNVASERNLQQCVTTACDLGTLSESETA